MRVLSRYDIDDLDNRDPRLIRVVAAIVERTLERYHRAEVIGVERIPEGPALYVGNHNAFAYTPETYLLGLHAYRAHGLGAVPHGLAHEVLLSWPGVNQFLSALGAVRASHHNGERLLAAGHKVLVYPGGDLEAARPFRDRHRIVFGGRRGYIRLALRAGVPIVPFVTAGAHSSVIVIDDLRWLARLLRAEHWLRLKVWPLTLSLPWGLTLGPILPFLPLPSRIRMEILEPITFSWTGREAADDDAYVAECAARVEGAMQLTLSRLARELESEKSRAHGQKSRHVATRSWRAG